MINKDFFAALGDLEKEKGIDKEFILSALETALTSAYKKNFGEAANVEVKVDPDESRIAIYSYKTVVEEVEDAGKEISLEEARIENPDCCVGDKIYPYKTVVKTVEDPEKEISLKDARLEKKTYNVGDKYKVEIVPRNFGRIAAQAAKQIVTQAIREAERNVTYAKYSDRENELILGTVGRINAEDGTIYVEIGIDQEGMLRQPDQNPLEHYRIGDRIRVYIKCVRESPRGVSIILSRTHVGFIRKLFEQEVPEIRAGIVEIKNIVREPGYRTKIAVWSNDPDIDAVGACVGNRGTRVNAIVNEIGGEKVDIIAYSDDILDYIARALSPAKVLMVQANEETRESKVIVSDEKLSLAIGKEGQNARLAARLTGWKIDVKSMSAAIRSGLIEPVNRDEDGGAYESGSEDIR